MIPHGLLSDFCACASFRIRHPAVKLHTQVKNQQNRASSYQISYKRPDMGKGGGTFERLLGMFRFYTFMFIKIDSAMYR